jgi:hypothetical protein
MLQFANGYRIHNHVVGAPPKSVPAITWGDFQFGAVSTPCVGQQHTHPRHRLLPYVWDDVMFIPATGCSKTVSAYQGKSPRIKEIGFVGTNRPHPGLIYSGAWRWVMPPGPADFILLTL